ncbi:aminopeptidase N [Brevibacterium salitolerans]|uniref:Aminopeptidase N n=1 Tax=Brevibacterium salitolerans TaxID=1403566 RepID=A0ABP5I2J9_9MICO
MPQHNLTRAEAQARAALLSSHGCDVTLVLDPSQDTFRSVTTLTFSAEEGAETFVDAIAESIDSVVLNGVELDPAELVSPGRIRLPGLAAENVLTVDGRFRYMNTGEGLHRFVDPVDGETYLYTQFEVPDSRRVFAVFEQPDLKSTFTFTVLAPEHWTVVSNSPTPHPADAAEAAGALGELPPGLRAWQFAPTPRISSYITAIVAGPYTSVHSSLTSTDGREIPLGAYCRASLAEHLDAEDIFAITRSGFALYEDLFGTPYPFEKYDQLFVPEFNAGAMENAGAVTFLESYVFRSRPTRAMVERRAVTILHELAHMWFGDLVTMRWWNDLWLNESFAEYMSTLATAEGTEFTDAWTTFATLEKSWAYRQDQLPSTHPIVAEITDLADVEVNFDGITYAKGASVLTALVSYVGRESFFAGLREYFAKHAWGNTELADLLTELERASGRDLGAWSRLWLEESGVNVLRAEPQRGEDGALTSVTLTQEPHVLPGQPVPSLRPHRVGVGFYRTEDGGGLTRLGRADVDLDGRSAEVPLPAGAESAEIVVVNDGDLTYAKARFDEVSLRLAMERLSGFEDTLTQLLVLSTVWDMVRDGELPAAEYVELLHRHLPAVSHSSGLLVQLRQLATALGEYVPLAERPALRTRIADRLLGLSRGEDGVEPGSDQQLQLFQALCRHACTDAHFEVLEEVLATAPGSSAAGSEAPGGLPGLVVDTDLVWTIVIALAGADRLTEAQIDAHLAADRTAAGQRHADTARAARTTAEAKSRAFLALVDQRDLPNARISAIAQGFSRGLQLDSGDCIPAQEPLTSFSREYFDRVTGWWETRTLEIAQTLTLALFPPSTAKTVEAAENWLSTHPQAPKGLLRLMRENLDNARRAQRAQQARRR